ncbi:MAG: hypothetical protein HZA24_10495 [Nitrospirae bacterium]|nr:hypothetical protein [Nitrospirota bacterium]
MRHAPARFLIVAAVWWLAAPGAAHAHRGELDDLGCHKDRISSYYHCHEGPLAGKRFPMRTAAERTLAKQEAARRSAAAASPSPAPVTPLMGAPGTFGPYRASLVRVADGTTLDLDVHVWPGQIQRVALRLDGVTGPRPDGAPCEHDAAVAAAAFASGWLDGVDGLVVSEVRPGGQAGLFLGRLALGGNDLGQALLAAGHARAADGTPWCAP